MTNILIAFKNLIEKSRFSLYGGSGSLNRMNDRGVSLEIYVRDLFCGVNGESNNTRKNKLYSTHLSYIGNQNNPPDFMIKGGDAVEIKKLEKSGVSLALNSSYPKNKLISSSTMITQACRNCEHWDEKDLIYVVGTVEGKRVKSLWFVYGDCYAADAEVYERIKNSFTSGVMQIPGLEFSSTNELARINRVDPLGITYMRVRGMWGIENPAKVFDYILSPIQNTGFSAHALLLDVKYHSLPVSDRVDLEKLVSPEFIIRDVEIKSPNNPAVLLSAKLLSYIKI